MIKLSGEAFLDGESVLSAKRLHSFVDHVNKLKQQGICIVVGGGNVVRGSTLSLKGIDAHAADSMGMVSTVINGLYLQELLQSKGISSRLFNGFGPFLDVENYTRREALFALESGDVVIFSGGIGNAGFTTDTAAVIRAVSMRCDLLIKLTKVQGVYTADPLLDEKAQFLPAISYDEVIEKNLAIMDMASIVVAKEHALPIRIASFNEGLFEAVRGTSMHTTIS